MSSYNILVILDMVVETTELSDLETQHGDDEVDCHNKGVDSPQHKVLSF